MTWRSSAENFGRRSSVLVLFSLTILVGSSAALAAASGNHVDRSAVTPRTGPVAVVKTLGAGKDPGSVALNTNNKDVYVANSGSANVTVVSTTTNTVVKSIKVGVDPRVVLYDPHNQKVYVLNGGPSTVSVIASNNTVSATITLGATTAINMIYDPANGAVYALSYKILTNFTLAYHLTRMNPSTNAITTLNVGSGTEYVVYDPATLDLVAAGSEANALTIVNSTTNALHTIALTGLYPSFLLYSPGTKDVYALDEGVGIHGITRTGNVSVLSTSNTIVATIKTANNPLSATAVPTSNEVYVLGAPLANVSGHKFPNGTVTVIGSNNKITTTIKVGREGVVATFDPANGDVYVPCVLSNVTDVINGTTNSLVGSPVPSKQYPGYAVYDPLHKEVLVFGDSNETGTPQPTDMTVISAANARVTTLMLGRGDVGGGVLDPTNSDGYLSNEAGNSISVVH
jgi:YVTN family beta-propeller protein